MGETMRNVILLMLLAGFNGKALAELVQIGGHGGLAIYTDSSSFRREGNIARMWNVYDYKIVQHGAGGRMYSSEEEQVEFDCEEEQMRTLYFSYRAGNMGEGELVGFNSSSDNIKWDPIQPDSTGALLWKYACGKK
jgi:hypothetical protein